MSEEIRKTNTGRQYEFDLAKVAAIFFMVIIHVADNMSAVAETKNAFAVLLDFTGGPLAAPVFMFAMGVGMVYTKHSEPADFAKRGLCMIASGYALNFFRETVLMIAAKVLSVDTVYEKALIDTIGTVDILHFAGMAFLFAALFKKLNAAAPAVFFGALVMQAAGTCVTGMFDAMPKALQYLLGLLFYTNQYVSFPSLLWFVYPAAGILFGSVLQHITDKDRFYKSITAGSAVTLTAVTVCVKAMNLDLESFFTGNEYYVQNLFGSLWILSIVLIFTGICYAISKRLSERAIRRISETAASVNTIYIIQWLLITYTIAVKELAGLGYLPSAAVIPAGIAFAICSIILAKLYRNGKERKCHTK